jgi:superfamily II DNA or RNA helicase
VSIALRPYQLECLSAIEAALEQHTRVLAVMATGLGKTVVFARLPARLRARRTLVLAHRRELIEQAAEKMRQANPELRVDVEQAELVADPAADVVIASVQTLRGRRLERWARSAFDLVIVDEAHHAVAGIYQGIFEYFGVMHDRTSLVGFTATPSRGDGVGLEAVFQTVAYDYGLREGVQDGWLTRPRAWRVTTGEDIRGVRSRGGDFSPTELAERVNTQSRNALAVRAYQRFAAGRPALAFTVTVEHAEDLAAAFTLAGIPALAVSGDTPAGDRKRALEDFRAGHIAVLTNCSLFTEGTDLPNVGAIVMARPTRSSALYAQMVGRGTRLFEGKTDLAIIDVVDATRTPLPSAASLAGLPARWDAEGKDLFEQAKELTRVARGSRKVFDEAVTMEQARRVAFEIDPLRVTSELRAELGARLTWSPMPDGSFVLAVPVSNAIVQYVARQDILGAWRVHVETGERSEGGRRAFPSSRAAVAAVEAFVERRHPDALRLLRVDSGWRTDSPTSKQRAALLRLGQWRDGLTKGAACDLLRALGLQRARMA